MPVSIFISKNYSGVALCSLGAHSCGVLACLGGGGGGGGGEGGYPEGLDAENEKKKKGEETGAAERRLADDCLSLVCVCVCIMSHQ